MPLVVTDYEIRRQNKLKQWVIGFSIGCAILVSMLAVSSGTFYHWRYNVSSDECDLFCQDSLGVSLAFIMVGGIGIVTILPFEIYFAIKLHKLNREIHEGRVWAAARAAEGIARKVVAA
ncbi:Hypothetical protein FSTVST1_457 [Faustovirus ST1]|nr:Hypothetical protein FSTVST1_457 [Faustovirus ST1]